MQIQTQKYFVVGEIKMVKFSLCILWRYMEEWRYNSIHS